MIRITFDSDEDAVVNDQNVPILIVDDLVNEASVQSFVVLLQLVSSVTPSLVDLTTRPASLCRIIDNDSKSKGDSLREST